MEERKKVFMHAPSMAGQEARDLLTKVLKNVMPRRELDREVFEEVYGLAYKPEFEHFCKTGELKPAVVAYCYDQLWRNKL